jgi:mRNA-degrading endonuclease RelE of RelBE toxin-antitoxin system
MAYRILYARPTEHHFRYLSLLQQKALLDAIDLQLAHQPMTQTKNRKRMRPNPLATWELRVGKLRAYYDVFTSPEAVVLIVAVGIKDRNTVQIGGEVVTL